MIFLKRETKKVRGLKVGAQARLIVSPKHINTPFFQTEPGRDEMRRVELSQVKLS